MSESSTNPDIAESSDGLQVLDLREYARVLLKRKWIILATAAVIVTASVLYTMRLPKIYQAGASIIIDPRPPEILGGQVQEVVQLGAGMWWNEDYYNTQVDILQSRKLARMTVTTFNLHQNPAIIGEGLIDTLNQDQRVEKAISILLGSLSIRQSDQNRIFEIRMRHQDPQLAAYLANKHVETYVQYTLNLRTEGNDVASQWLSGELDVAEKQLRDAETELYEYKKDNDILSVSLEDRQNLIAGNIKRYTDALNDAKMQVVNLRALRARVTQVKSMDVLESPVFVLTESATGELLKQQYYEERRKLTEIEADYGEKAPEYRSQKQKVDEIHASLTREATIAAQAIEQKFQAAVARVASYQQELERHRKEAFELGPKEVEYNRLARTEKSNEQKLDIILGRLRTSDLSGRLKTVNIRPLDAARVPGSPAFPRMERNVALAGILSLFIGIAFAFFLEYLDRTVKSGEDVEKAVGAPLLGIIPAISDEGAKNAGERGSLDLHVFEEPSSRAAECCRHIRTNLLFMAAEHKFKTLVVASPSPREGKSTTCMYLATTMAQSEQRVLVIDSDLRRPRLHQSLGTSRNQGLSNLILGNVALDDVIKTTDIPNLWFLPAGPTPPNPAELLMTERFTEILAELGERFDRIILDSPPILAVTDPLVLAKNADGIVLVMKAGSTTRDHAQRAARQLYDVDARVAGAILNELDVDDKSYGYYYHYYGYGYGEGEGTPAEAGQSA